MKKILFFVVSLLMAMPTYAQTDDGEEEFVRGREKSHVLFVGPKLGATMTTMTQPDGAELYDSFGLGFSGGAVMKIRFGKASLNSQPGTGRWGVGLELKYKQNKVKTFAVDETGEEGANLEMDYFEVPVYCHFYPFMKSRTMNSFYVEMGAAVAGSLSAKPDMLTMENISYKTGDLKGFDIRPMFGLGWSIPNTGLDINARYCLGTSDLAGNFPCKMSSFEISFSWMFKLAKF